MSQRRPPWGRLAACAGLVGPLFSPKAGKRRAWTWIQFAFALAALAYSHFHPHAAQWAYVGPGAGFAFLGSFLTLIAGFFLSVFSLLAWPFRMAWRAVRRRKGYRHARVKKIVFLGLDGLDPRLTERLMAEGKLPNLARLAAEGSYTRLRTTFPALSPVAWSTFATGVSPAKHNIFDFLDRSLKSYCRSSHRRAWGKPARVLRLGRCASRFRGRRWNCAARASRSGRSWGGKASAAPSCACRSRFRRRSSTAGCSPPCARRT
jgi:hypothetical protein